MEHVLTLAGQAATAFVVLILFRAFWHKITAYLEVVGFAQDYELVPERWTYGLVRALTVLEGIAILALAFPATRLAGAVLAAGLFAGYGVIMALALKQGKTQIECGCGGTPQVVSPVTLARNAVLVVLALGAGLAPNLAPDAPVGMWAAGAAILVALTLWLSLTVAETLDATRARVQRLANPTSSKEV